MERYLGIGGVVASDGGDERMGVEVGFGLAHSRDGAAEHHLDGQVGVVE